MGIELIIARDLRDESLNVLIIWMKRVFSTLHVRKSKDELLCNTTVKKEKKKLTGG